MKIQFVEQRFNAATLALIQHANDIIDEYREAGFVLTLRQLYYQFVARDIFANTVRNYKRLGSAINDARLAGRVDWDAIEDRTRNLTRSSTWSSPAEIVDACAEQYRRDLWGPQPRRVEVWIEKEALAGVFERPCDEFRVPFLSCRGYVSQSEMFVAASRFAKYQRAGQSVVVLHFGDHDPSGVDMSRDIVDRLRVFGVEVEFRRLALNFEQVEQFDPPPNPAKVTDSRFATYEAQFGSESWELDALEPRVLARLVAEAVEDVVDRGLWERELAKEGVERATLESVARKLRKGSK